MSEAAIAAGIKTTLQAMAEFANADIVDNDYGVMDGDMSQAPYVIIGTSDDFISEQDTQDHLTIWDINITLIEAFDTWETTLGTIRTNRQAILDIYNSTTSNARSAGGLEGVSINEIRADGPLVPVYPNWLDPDLEADSDPIYIMAPMIFVCEEF